MKLFIFEASEQWRYGMGGGAIIAESFACIADLLKNEAGYKTPAVYETEASVPENADVFVLVESFDVPDQPPRVVMLNWDDC